MGSRMGHRTAWFRLHHLLVRLVLFEEVHIPASKFPCRACFISTGDTFLTNFACIYRHVHSGWLSKFFAILRGSLIRRWSCCRSGTELRNQDADVEAGGSEKSVKQTKTRNQSLVSGLAYCVSSCGMILLNKTALSGYGLNGGISLMFYQVWALSF